MTNRRSNCPGGRRRFFSQPPGANRVARRAAEPVLRAQLAWPHRGFDGHHALARGFKTTRASAPVPITKANARLDPVQHAWSEDPGHDRLTEPGSSGHGRPISTHHQISRMLPRTMHAVWAGRRKPKRSRAATDAVSPSGLYAPCKRRSVRASSDRTPATTFAELSASSVSVWSDRTASDLPPGGPSFITRVLGVDSGRRRFGQGRRARSLQIARAPGALLRGSGSGARNAA